MTLGSPSKEAILEPDRQHKVLVADDDPMMGAFLGTILEEMAETKLVQSGEEALQALKEEEFDVVLLDVEMPGMGGLAACKAIKSSPETEHVSVIIVTSHTGEEMELDALDIGATDFITKPFVAKIVQARVRTHLLMQSQSRQLRLLSLRDGLTGIANRRCFDQTLEAECRRANRSHDPLSLMLVDIDYFKKYNDAYGHLKGDDCLRLVADTLAKSARRAGDLVARTGGEEFAFILPDTNADQLRNLAERVKTAIEHLEISHVHGVDSIVTISIGGTTTNAATSVVSPQNLYTTADAFLYQAKADGRNQFHLA